MPDPYETNLRVLNKKHPKAALALAAPPEAPLIRVERSRTGWPVLLLAAENGDEIPLYDREDPVEAVRAELSSHVFRAEDATLLMGFGLGYHAEAIARRMEIDHQLFVVEPCAEVFRAALEQRDLRPILEHDRVHVFVGPCPEGLCDVMEYHLLRMVAGTFNELSVTPLELAYPGPYAEAEANANKIRLHLVHSFRFNLDNEDLLRNLLVNAGRLEACGDTGGLAGILDGEPAIVIAGGPSLSDNIHLLEQVRGRAALLCVDTALRPLLARGVRPDLVVAADPFPQNARKIEGLEDAKDIPLLFDVGTHHAVPSHFDGPRFAASNQNALAKWLIRLMGFQDSAGRTTSAAHLAFHAARWMQADPIVFAGLDLAFPGDAHHVEGSAFTWAPPEDGPFVTVPDIHGRPVKTLPGFEAQIGLFEREIAETPARCIDATEGGARIAGTEIAALAEVIRDLGPPLEPAVQSRLKGAFRTGTGKSGDARRAGLNRLAAEARTVGNAAQDALPLLTRARDLLSRGRLTSPEFRQTATLILDLDRRLGDQALFEEVMIDFRAELLAFQFLQSYRIQRETRQEQNLELTLESMEHSFQDAARVSGHVLSLLEGPGAGDPDKGPGGTT